MKIIKVLVDEMPSGCKRCNFCVAKMYCSLLEDRKTTVPDEPYKRRADCPLVYDFGDRETNALNKRIAELEEERRWIPVSERLPEENQIVAVIDMRGNGSHSPLGNLYEVAMWVEVKGDKMFWFICGSNWASCDVTHWMPLPKPPEVQ